MKGDVISNPAITAVELKKKNKTLNFSRTSQQGQFATACRSHAAKKPMLTAIMKKKRLMFCKNYAHGTPENWMKVIFSDENTFRLVIGASKFVRRPKTASQYDPKFTVKTVKHPDSVMV